MARKGKTHRTATLKDKYVFSVIKGRRGSNPKSRYYSSKKDAVKAYERYKGEGRAYLSTLGPRGGTLLRRKG